MPSAMPSPPALTLGLFGFSSLLAGTTTLLHPSLFLTTFSLPSAALPAVYANGLAATAMGLYYLLAAYQENRLFCVATVPMRLLTTAVFWSQGPQWRVPAIWEGVGAVSTAVAVIYERWGTRKSSGKTS